MAEHHKTCVQCGAEFVAGSNRQRFCSRSCQSTARRRQLGIQANYTQNCEICSKEFHSRFRVQKYCGNRCKMRARRLADPEGFKLMQQMWRDANPEKCAHYRERHKKSSDQRKSYYWANPEVFRKRCRDYHHSHKEKVSDRKREKMNCSLVAAGISHVMHIITAGSKHDPR